jgi:5-formyltetrahydrofolate cyclo-ligase
MTMKTGTSATKIQIRNYIKQQLNSLDNSMFDVKSKRIYEKLLSLNHYKQAELVLIYIATHREVQTTYIIKSVLADGKMVYAPRIAGKELCFHLINKAEGNLKPNRYGIPEPEASLPPLAWDTIAERESIIIVPGMAFDGQKNRLGRGKGFYDRFLNQIKKLAAQTCTLIGICFSEQLFPVLPVNEDDVSMDIVITDKGMVS